jgi:hypothetical protein
MVYLEYVEGSNVNLAGGSTEQHQLYYAVI